MSEGKVKASKVRVHAAPDGTGGADGHFHIYIYDVFNKTFLPGKTFDNVERAAQHQRHLQERIYLEQEADPELFDLPFISADAALIDRVQADDAYRTRLMRDLDGDARSRGRKR
jgi:hypothetical protein